MSDWLIKMAEQAQTDEARLHAALSELGPEELRHMALDSGATEPTENYDGLVSRMSEADLMGREMAHLHGDEVLEKVAIFPAIGAAAARFLPMLARGAKGLVSSGMAKEVATDVVKNKAVEGIGSALSRNRQTAQTAAPVATGAFKYASGGLADLISRYPKSTMAAGGGALGAGYGAATAPKGKRLKAARNHGAGGAIGGAIGGHIGNRLGTNSAKAKIYDEMVSAHQARRGTKGIQVVHGSPGASSGKVKNASRRLIERAAYLEFCKEAGVMQSIAGGLTAGSKTTGIVRRGAAMMRANPTAAAAVAGGVLNGGMAMLRDPGYDEQGNKKSRIGAGVRGAAVGAAGGAAAAHFIPGAKQSIQNAGRGLHGEMKAKGLITPRLQAGRDAAAAAAAKTPAGGGGAGGTSGLVAGAEHGGGVASGGVQVSTPGGAHPAATSIQPAQPGAPALAHGTPPQGVPTHIPDETSQALGQIRQMPPPTPARTGNPMIDGAEAHFAPQRAQAQAAREQAAYNAEPDFSHLAPAGTPAMQGSALMQPRQGPIDRLRANMADRSQVRQQAKAQALAAKEEARRAAIAGNSQQAEGIWAGPDGGGLAKAAMMKKLASLRLKKAMEKRAANDLMNRMKGAVMGAGTGAKPGLPSLSGAKSIAGGGIGLGAASKPKITALPGSGW